LAQVEMSTKRLQTFADADFDLSTQALLDRLL